MAIQLCNVINVFTNYLEHGKPIRQKQYSYIAVIRTHDEGMYIYL